MTDKRAVRVIILPRGYCDLRCVFCHEEHVPAAKSRVGAPSTHLVRQALIAGKEHGLNAIKFSGGEPLLAWDKVRDLLDVVPGAYPTTIVTNGAKLPLLLAWQRQTSRAVTLHVNVPSVDPLKYSAIAGCRPGRLPLVMGWLSTAVTQGVRVELNCVITAKHNDTFSDAEAVLAAAAQRGFARVRFIEHSDQASRQHRAIGDVKFPGWDGNAAREYLRRQQRSFLGESVAGVETEFLVCDTSLVDSAAQEIGDLFLMPPNIVRLGLSGPTNCVSSADDISAFLSRHGQSASP